MAGPESTDTPTTSSTPAAGAAPEAAAPTSAPAPAPAPAGAPTAPAPEAVAAEALAAAKKEAAENYDRYLRAVADLENFRRRAVREKDELRQFGVARVLEDLLPVMDNLNLGLTAAKQPGADLKALTGGVELVLNQFKTALANHGLKEVQPAGQPFDANLHESISAQPSETVPEGSVVTVVRVGYTLNGRLLRPASVIVSSGAAKPAEAKA
ncbi:MAG: nucleotide exchange factor GrpE [Verrucomicrobia bacterium]|nr:nucleotide exchange factor GrpE [Verrucomicrobiota bacterium]